MIEDTISKVTTQIPEPAPPISTPMFNQLICQYPMLPQPYAVTQCNPPGLLHLPFNHTIPHNPISQSTTQLPPPEKLTPAVGPDHALPADILHILESDFTNGAPHHYTQNEQQIHSVAEELKFKVRLGHYRDLPEQSANHQGEDMRQDEKSDTSASESGDSEDNSIEEEEAEEVDGSGDEEAERVRNNQALAKLKTEIEEIIGIPEEGHPPQPVEKDQPHPKTEDNLISNHSPQASSCAVHDGSLASPKSQTCSPKPVSPRPVEDDIPSRCTRRARGDPEGSGDDSDATSEISNDFIAGPTTVHELTEPPPEVTEVPFTHVSDEEMKTMTPFGSVASLIRNVLVIRGTAGLGYDRVLDEGTLVCRRDGMVIGKIFETFGSVTSPHYSIRLPDQLLSSEEHINLSPGLELYYLPTHSNFVFTSELRAQPKGTDASNFYDEEVDHGDEIEFSDDEAEAAYLRACKQAKKASAFARNAAGGQSQDNRPEGSSRRPSNRVNISEKGRKMFIKRPPENLCYDDEDESRQGAIESDYSLLERPPGFSGAQHPSNSPSAHANPTKTPSSNQTSKGKRRTRGRERNRKNGLNPKSNYLPAPSVDKPPQTCETNQMRPPNSSFGGPSDFRSAKNGNTELANHAIVPNSDRRADPFQFLSGTETIGAAEGIGSMGFYGRHMLHASNQYMNPSLTYPPYWGGSLVGGVGSTNNNQNGSMTMQTMMSTMQPGIPCYNPLNPSAHQVIPSPATFQFQFPNLHLQSNGNSAANPLNSSEQLPHQSQEIQSSYPFHFTQFIHPHSNNHNSGHFNPHFFNSRQS